MFIEILISILASRIGVSEFVLTDLFKKHRILREDKKQTQALSSKIEKLTNSLKESSELMQEIELEFEKQKELATKWKEQADTSKVIASMNQQEIEAVSKLFGGQLEKENKKSNRQSLIQNALFCIIGLVGGYLISRFLL